MAGLGSELLFIAVESNACPVLYYRNDATQFIEGTFSLSSKMFFREVSYFLSLDLPISRV